MNYTMIKEARELAGWNAEREALSVYQTLEKLTDKRRAQGKRYSLALVLSCVLLAKMAGETTLQAITEWVRLRGSWLHQVLPETRAQFPCAATYCKVLRGLDPEQVNQLLMELLTRLRAEKRAKGEQTHVVLDGKTLRGTLGHLAEDQQNMHHMNLYEAKTGIVLKQRMVAEKAGELTHLKDFLTPTLLKGRTISADALYTQKAFCQEVIASGGEYLLFAKRNQPTLYEDLRLFFHDPPLDCVDWRTDSMADKGHGRRSSRLIQVSVSHSMTSWPAIGTQLDRSFVCVAACNIPSNVRRNTSTASRVSPLTRRERCAYLNSFVSIGALKTACITVGMWLWAKMRAKFARGLPLMLLPFSMPLCWLSSIAVA